MNASSLRTRIGLALVLSNGVGAACAATFNVTRFDDPVPGACLPSDCSLREAVMAANALPDADTILLGGGVYELTQTSAGADEVHRDLDIRAPLTISGLGSPLTTVRMALPPGGTEQRVFEARYVAFALAGLTVRDGYTVQPIMGLSGGCLSAIGLSLTLDDVRFTHCQADLGGALSLLAVDAQMKGVSVDGNSAQVGGGLVIAGTTLRGDANLVASNAATSGGGIHVSDLVGYRESRIAWDTRSRIADNSATSDGGGIHVQSGVHLVIEPMAPATVVNGDLLLIENNRARQHGGGISVSGVAGALLPGSLDARRVALRRNQADVDGGALHAGGRLFLSDSELLLNTAGFDGGGIAVRADARQSRVERVSFARNAARRYGGAMSNNIDSVAVINSTTYGNSANVGGGAFDLRGFTELQQVTSLNDSSPQGASVRFDAAVNSRNSVFSTGCFSPSALNMIEWGGSAQVTGQSACAGTYSTASQLGLKYAYFGGRFPIVGIASSVSVLRNAAVPAAYLDMRDIRHHQRTLPTDAGAHDIDGSP